MQLDKVIEFFISSLARLFNQLDLVVFRIAGISVSWLTILLSFSALCIIIAVFWRGVRK